MSNFTLESVNLGLIKSLRALDVFKAGRILRNESPLSQDRHVAAQAILLGEFLYVGKQLLTWNTGKRVSDPARRGKSR